MKERIPCKPDCNVDLDTCGQVYLLSDPHQFPCQLGVTIEQYLTPEELEIFKRERENWLQRFARP